MEGSRRDNFVHDPVICFERLSRILVQLASTPVVTICNAEQE